VPKAVSCTAANDRRLEQRKLDYKSQPCIGAEHDVYTLPGGTFFMRLPHLLALALIGLPYICNAQTPADDVAAQIRSQGYRCDQPVAAKRDLRRSKPDSAVWVLNCRNATFRVRLDPNMAARITKLKNKS
jgi:hypothetical protein